MDHSSIPPRSTSSWETIEGTGTSYAEPFVVNTIALPHDSSMIDVTICYPVSPINEHQRVGRAVRIDLRHTYFQSFSSDVSRYMTFVEESEIWSLCVTDQSNLKSDFIAGLQEWAPAAWLPAPDTHLRHFALGRDHHGYLHFLAVDGAVRFFDVDWAPIDQPYDPNSTYAEQLEQQHSQSRFLVDRAAELGPPAWPK